MGTSDTAQVNEQAVKDIISSKNVTTFFQPVVSISTKSIVGFEAFSRGGSSSACVLDPALLFHDDLPPEIKVQMDALCREKALAQFKPIHQNHKGLLLFLNINADVLPLLKPEQLILPEQVSEAGVDPANVVLECTLSNQYVEQIMQYRERFTSLNFRGSLDNCSVDDSFSHTISLINPDFVKINRSFFGNDDRKDYSAKALEALCEVADRAGASVVAQGVENEQESIRLLSAGVHLQQGYYYTKDENDKTGDPAKMFFQKIIDTYEKYKVVKRELVRRKKERFSQTFKTVTSICAKFSNMPENRFEDACKTLVQNVDSVISIFVLNNDGVQITARHHSKKTDATTNSDSILGMQKGVDHSVQDYVMYLDMGYEKFVTQPFRSPFSGENACLISRPFFNHEGSRYMVCIELPHPG